MDNEIIKPAPCFGPTSTVEAMGLACQEARNASWQARYVQYLAEWYCKEALARASKELAGRTPEGLRREALRREEYNRLSWAEAQDRQYNRLAYGVPPRKPLSYAGFRYGAGRLAWLMAQLDEAVGEEADRIAASFMVRLQADALYAAQYERRIAAARCTQ